MEEGGNGGARKKETYLFAGAKNRFLLLNFFPLQGFRGSYSPINTNFSLEGRKNPRKIPMQFLKLRRRREKRGGVFKFSPGR